MKRSIKNAKWSQGRSRVTRATDKTKSNIAMKLKAQNSRKSFPNLSKGKK